MAAWTAAPPPFAFAWYGATFRQRSLNLRWLAAGLARNAVAEGQGARKLWQLAARTADPRIASLVRQHAIDESRHALVYLAMLDTVFPSALPPEDRAALRASCPRYRVDDRPAGASPVPRHRLLDELVQMNIGEIRTRINQQLLAPALLTVCAAVNRRRLRRMLNSVLSDETRHIAYTAALLDHALAGPDDQFVVRTLHTRLAQFNRRTVDEIGISMAPSRGRRRS